MNTLSDGDLYYTCNYCLLLYCVRFNIFISSFSFCLRYKSFSSFSQLLFSFVFLLLSIIFLIHFYPLIFALSLYRSTITNFLPMFLIPVYHRPSHLHNPPLPLPLHVSPSPSVSVHRLALNQIPSYVYRVYRLLEMSRQTFIKS